jgi:hypothetical protein
MTIEFPQPDNNSFNIGNVILSKAGIELTTTCQASPCEGFVEYLKQHWIKLGYKVSDGIRISGQSVSASSPSSPQSTPTD